MKLENKRYRIDIVNGILTGFYDKSDPEGSNLADQNGKMGTVCFTLMQDDITVQPHEANTPYDDRTAVYDAIRQADGFSIFCSDQNNQIKTKYVLTDDGLTVQSETRNGDISAFGLNLDLNFMGKKGGDYRKQLLPSSPYTSENGAFCYCIMPVPDGRFFVAAATTACDGWKIKYSPYSYGHFILNFQFLASFDKVYRGSFRKKLCLKLFCVNSIEEAFAMLRSVYHMPLCVNVLNGGFDGLAAVRVLGKADYLKIKTPSGKLEKQKIHEENSTIQLRITEYGLHTVIPVWNGEDGLSTTVWNGGNFAQLFDKSCDAVKKPYHPDDNLCEGGCFLWEMLKNMEIKQTLEYDEIAKHELGIIMGKGEHVPRKTIIHHETKTHAPYHICGSDRIQEQFFGASILMDAYRVYQKPEILEFAVAALNELVENYIRDGMVYNGTDYTTVCCPAIPLVDMANLLAERGDARTRIFRTAAMELADFLVRRGFDFPTEGEESDLTETEKEDGSISCTALSLLYICRHLEYRAEYFDFARKVLKLHKAWTIYTPDARMNGSSFRWWETIWEGDGEGPAICAGHAWTIWKAEALFYGGLLSRDDRMLLDSWNGFVTNFSKTQADGTMYSCYEADYIRGGGVPKEKKHLKQLQGENLEIKYITAHDYPSHTDSSLSRYAWVRAAETWYKTAALLRIGDEIVPINIRKESGRWRTEEHIQQLYLGEGCENVLLDRAITLL